MAELVPDTAKSEKEEKSNFQNVTVLKFYNSDDGKSPKKQFHVPLWRSSNISLSYFNSQTAVTLFSHTSVDTNNIRYNGKVYRETKLYQILTKTR